MEYVTLYDGVKMPILGYGVYQNNMEKTEVLDPKQSSFFLHTDSKMVEWFCQTVEQRKKNNDHEKEKKNWQRD